MNRELLFFNKHKELLAQFRCGLERETLRISKLGKLSNRPHPPALGSPLTHPYLGVDFGEAQLEWNTPPFPSLVKAENFLRDLMIYTAKVNPSELFWPYSMPCPLPDDLQLARFGTSHAAKKKELYRKGLCYRYGKNVQMISGLHFNFSLPAPFWDFYYSKCKPKKSKREFIDDCYFKIIQNFLHEGWILTYLFGASPAMHDKTFPNATSLRMSYLGYYSRIQNQLAISFENLPNYIRDMEFAISTPFPKYGKAKADLQINDHFLQIENEHYGRIRPKQRLHKGETPLQALKNRGVEYLEIRAIDINPFTPLGIERDQLVFLHQFLLYCLFKKDAPLTKEKREALIANQQRVALEGRKAELILKSSRPISLEKWGTEILFQMSPLASLLGESLQLQKEKIANKDLLPSSRILKELETESLESFGLKWAKTHAKNMPPLPNARKKHFDETVKHSKREKKVLETASEVLVEGHENLELSTQILMREAMSQCVEVEVVDENLLRLSKNGHTEFVKQATRTSQDPCVVCHLMQNKYATKQILQRAGFSVPSGKLYRSKESAASDYANYAKKKIVVKPKSTNFGIGITFVEPQDEKGYIDALEEAFNHELSVIVESYQAGKEYRFLVIDGKVEGVIHRIPAHVIGDGKCTIKELVHLKNHDPTFYRSPNTHLCLTKNEKAVLSEQGFTESSIPPKRKKVFLRKNSNISTGGDAIDMTDTMHKSYFSIATRATEAIGAKICGVDMLISSFKVPATKKNQTIIELNDNPVLFPHAFPNKGKKRHVARPILKLLGF